MATIALRANGGRRRGFGHVRRTLTLAQAIHQAGNRAVLIVSADEDAGLLPPDPGIEIVSVEDREIESLHDTLEYLRVLGAAALVVDSYDVPPATLASVPVPVAMILDSAPPSRLPVAMLVNASMQSATEAWPLLPATRLLVGPRYALVREEFIGVRRPPVRNIAERVMITTGATDGDGWILTLAQLVREVLPHAELDVIVGRYFAAATISALRTLAASGAITVHAQPTSMSDRMIAADLAVTAGGQTILELAATGTPAVGVCLAENQRENLTSLASNGCLSYAGSIDDDEISQRIATAVAGLARDPERRAAMSVAGRLAVDGRGAARVAEALFCLPRLHDAKS